MGKSKYCNELKAYCIDNGLVDYVRDTTKKKYKSEDSGEFLEWFWYMSTHKELDCSNRLLESKYRKYSRARKHIQKIVMEGNAVFLTLTFTNDVLSKTSAATRRKYVARYLKEQSPYYVGNIDYSPGKEREHYHAVVFNRVDASAWKYGFIWCEEVRTHDYNCSKVSQYIVKLTSHAFKVNSTRLLYSRVVLE